MISKYPDNTFKECSSSIYEEWDKYLEETIKATPYFYLESEKTTECTDKLIVSEEEVFCKTLKNSVFFLQKSLLCYILRIS